MTDFLKTIAFGWEGDGMVITSGWFFNEELGIMYDFWRGSLSFILFPIVSSTYASSW